MSPLLNILAAGSACPPKGFFGLIPWWYYLPPQDFNGCDIVNFSPLSASGLPLILLAVIDDALRIIGIVAVGYLLYGAIQYMTSQGNSEQTSKALSTIINALVGLGIAIIAVALVSFLGSKLGG